MDNKKLIDYINNEFENEFLDFKLEVYDWHENKDKEDFLKDVVSLANSRTNNDRFLILGAKVKQNGERILKGINTKELLDGAVYQEFVTEHIEPEISIETKIINNDGLNYGIIRIFNCDDKPYLIKKKFNDLEQGFIKIRRGSRNSAISRYSLDQMYLSKNPIQNSEFKIFGLKNGNISDNIELGKYEYLPDLDQEKENLINLIKKINTIEIDDYKEENTSITDNLVGANIFQKNVLPSHKVEIDKKIMNNINEFARTLKIEINTNFYDVGNLSESFNGISTNLIPLYKQAGSEKSKEKYRLIIDLDCRINDLVSWTKFINGVKKYRYLELAIKETGNVSDEEVEINIELPKESYVDYDDFPSADPVVVEEINDKYSEEMFKIKHNSNISDFRKMPIPSASVHTPNISISNLGRVSIIEGIYDFIDYDVTKNKDKTILKCTIKSIKENEIMAFPGKIILNSEIEEIRYSIISKKSKEKIVGILKIK